METQDGESESSGDENFCAIASSNRFSVLSTSKKTQQLPATNSKASQSNVHPMTSKYQWQAAKAGKAVSRASEFSTKKQHQQKPKEMDLKGTSVKNAPRYGRSSFVRCPFNIKLICNSCFHASGAVVYQNGSYCASRSSHTWEHHKGMVVIDGGKLLPLRNVPGPILRNRQAGKPAFVRMCFRMEKYKKCTFLGCDFAHHDLERKCWLWALKNGKDLMAVAEPLSKVTIPEQKAMPTAVQSVTVPIPLKAWSMSKPVTTLLKAPTNRASLFQTTPNVVMPKAPMPNQSPVLRTIGTANMVVHKNTLPASAVAPNKRAPFSLPNQPSILRTTANMVMRTNTLPNTAVPINRPAPFSLPPPAAVVSLPEMEETIFYCYLCNKNVEGRDSYDEHLKSTMHQDRSRLVEKRCVWKHRLPPCAPPFQLCDRHLQGNRCVYSSTSNNRCKYAHTTEELEEWSERCELLSKALRKRSNQEVEELKAKINEAKKFGKSILSPFVDDVEITCVGSTEEPVARIEKGQSYMWRFTIGAEKKLKRVLLLDHYTLPYFRLRSQDLTVYREGIAFGEVFEDKDVEGMYEVLVEFVGISISQTFTQKVAFDFGEIPIVYREVVVHSDVPIEELQKQDALRYLLTPAQNRWDAENAEIIWISKERYAERIDVTNVVANLNFDLNEANYFSLLKQWLFAEEFMRQSILDELRVEGVEVAARPFVTDDQGERLYSMEGSLFIEVPLNETFTEDIDSINLLREDCLSAFVATAQRSGASSSTMMTAGKKPMVYEVHVVNKLSFGGRQGVFSDRVHVQLSRLFVRHMQLFSGSRITIDIQFNLFTKQFRRWLRGLERLQERQLAPLIFPDLLTYFSDYATGKLFENSRAKIREFPYLQTVLKRQHNETQYQVMEHIILCAVNRKSWIPPLVIFGPFGTGKTRTLAAAAALLIKNFSETRILICTHAHTTADMYIRLLLEHTGWEERPLAQIMWRLYHKRATPDNKRFLRYGVDPETGREHPVPLTAEQLRKMRVVLCTFDSSPKLLKILAEDEDENEKVAFTHIFIDEAAQALELETVLPLCLAKRSTCVVIAGDHHQLRPPVYLPQATELNRSYLERLYEYYDKQKNSLSVDKRNVYHFPSVLFNRNYRCHPEILSFLSATFYGDPSCLIPCVQSYDDKEIKPLYFVVSLSDEEIGKNASICNKGEAKAVVEQVEYLWKNWPKLWGDKSIGVAVPYNEQGFIIREALRAKELLGKKVDVSRVIEMQGKEYKALVISTVRGKTQLQSAQAMGATRARNLGFLQNSRLINTAMTRSKYTVIVVGDPTVLCSLGECRDIWYRFIETCGRQGTLLGGSWEEVSKKIAFVRANTAASKKDNLAATISVDDILIQQLTKKAKDEKK